MANRDRDVESVERALRELEKHVRGAEYAGYDPYDALTGFIPFSKWGKWPPVLAIQMGKRLPINIRPLLGISRARNPKALGLFLYGYAVPPASDENRRRCRHLFDQLMGLRSRGASGSAWGYPFPWAGPAKYLAAGSPTAVATGFVAQGIEAYYRRYGDERAREALADICEFLNRDLHHLRRGDDYAISYSTVAPDFCYNASLLAAQAYAMAYAHCGEGEYAEKAADALRTVLSRQESDGRWDYSEDWHTGRRRTQTDFHQGFLIDSILSIADNLGERCPDVSSALSKGFEFYRTHQFASDGRALWRYPKSYPTDIHHQAQGILTAARMFRATGSPEALDLARKTTRYALERFRAPEGGFYYRRHRLFTDKTRYMRWGNAWMFLALSEMLEVCGAESPIESPTEVHSSPLQFESS